MNDPLIDSLIDPLNDSLNDCVNDDYMNDTLNITPHNPFHVFDSTLDPSSPDSENDVFDNFDLFHVLS